MMVPRALLLLLLVTIMMESVSAKRPRPPRPKRPCKYNKEKYPAGDVILSIPDTCVVFKCSDKGRKTELALIEGCDCCKPVTELPTEPPTQPPKPTTIPPKPTTVPPKPTTVPPKPTTVPSNPVTDGSSDSDCDYSATFGTTHTMNLAANNACAYHLNEVSASDRNLILETHNRLRAKVANGLEDGAIDGSQPSATNMFELRWNTELAKVAQAWAEQCPSGHDGYDDRNICDQAYTYTGQNIYTSWGWTSASKWAYAVDSWYSEVEYMTSDLVDSFVPDDASGVIGHYTQVVWADTYEVGCGAIHYSDKHGTTTYPQTKKYVCNYGPNGNWLNSQVYESGSTATNCPFGASETYEGLCAGPPAWLAFSRKATEIDPPKYMSGPLQDIPEQPRGNKK